MKIDLKTDSKIEFFDNNTFDSIAKENNIELLLLRRNLAIFKTGKPLAKFTSTIINYEKFEQKLIAFTINASIKHILFEFSGSNDDISSIIHLIKNHNLGSNYKSPLALNFSNQIRDSVLMSNNEANLRGFLNLFFILALLTYFRLILESVMKHRNLFKNTVK